MSVYFIKGKGWRYTDFTLNGIRHTESGLKSKLAARKAEVKRREDLESPAPKTVTPTILYTRKKSGGHLTPRKVAMTEKLHEVLSRRHLQRDENKPWVFWHTYTSSKTGEKKEGPYQDLKKIMKTLCRKAGVKYFRFHALRHSGASIMDNCNVPISAI